MANASDATVNLDNNEKSSSGSKYDAFRPVLAFMFGTDWDPEKKDEDVGPKEDQQSQHDNNNNNNELHHHDDDSDQEMNDRDEEGESLDEAEADFRAQEAAAEEHEWETSWDTFISFCHEHGIRKWQELPKLMQIYNNKSVSSDAGETDDNSSHVTRQDFLRLLQTVLFPLQSRKEYSLLFRRRYTLAHLCYYLSLNEKEGGGVAAFQKMWRDNDEVDLTEAVEAVSQKRLRREARSPTNNTNNNQLQQQSYNNNHAASLANYLAKKKRQQQHTASNGVMWKEFKPAIDLLWLNQNQDADAVREEINQFIAFLQSRGITKLSGLALYDRLSKVYEIVVERVFDSSHAPPPPPIFQNHEFRQRLAAIGGAIASRGPQGIILVTTNNTKNNSALEQHLASLLADDADREKERAAVANFHPDWLLHPHCHYEPHHLVAPQEQDHLQPQQQQQQQAAADDSETINNANNTSKIISKSHNVEATANENMTESEETEMARTNQRSEHINEYDDEEELEATDLESISSDIDSTIDETINQEARMEEHCRETFSHFGSADATEYFDTNIEEMSEKDIPEMTMHQAKRFIEFLFLFGYSYTELLKVFKLIQRKQKVEKCLVRSISVRACDLSVRHAKGYFPYSRMNVRRTEILSKLICQLHHLEFLPDAWSIESFYYLLEDFRGNNSWSGLQSLCLSVPVAAAYFSSKIQRSLVLLFEQKPKTLQKIILQASSDYNKLVNEGEGVYSTAEMICKSHFSFFESIVEGIMVAIATDKAWHLEDLTLRLLSLPRRKRFGDDALAVLFALDTIQSLDVQDGYDMPAFPPRFDFPQYKDAPALQSAHVDKHCRIKRLSLRNCCMHEKLWHTVWNQLAGAVNLREVFLAPRGHERRTKPASWMEVATSIISWLPNLKHVVLGPWVGHGANLDVTECVGELLRSDCIEYLHIESSIDPHNSDYNREYVLNFEEVIAQLSDAQTLKVLILRDVGYCSYEHHDEAFKDENFDWTEYVWQALNETSNMHLEQIEFSGVSNAYTISPHESYSSTRPPKQVRNYPMSNAIRNLTMLNKFGRSTASSNNATVRDIVGLLVNANQEVMNSTMTDNGRKYCREILEKKKESDFHLGWLYNHLLKTPQHWCHALSRHVDLSNVLFGLLRASPNVWCLLQAAESPQRRKRTRAVTLGGDNPDSARKRR